MTIVDFFDIHDFEHIKAWKHLCEHGQWPEGFIPEGTVFQPMWQVLLADKMADAWVLYQYQLAKRRGIT